MCWKFLTTMESLLNGEATFAWILNPCLWCIWLIFKCCGTLLLMEKENGRLGIGYVNFGEMRYVIEREDLRR
jgi:hypothetical protein